MLAEEWEAADDLQSFKVKLRKGVQFHDNFGEFNADDFIFTIEEVNRPGYVHGSRGIRQVFFCNLSVEDIYGTQASPTPTPTPVPGEPTPWQHGARPLEDQHEGTPEPAGEPCQVTKIDDYTVQLTRPEPTFEITWHSRSPGGGAIGMHSKKHYEAVTLVHNETSTGVMNPLASLAEVMADYPETFFLVDCVSSMGGVPIAIDEWGIDVALAGIQKAFGLPPGLSVAVVTPRVLVKSQSLSDVGYYFSFPVFERYAARHQTPTTPAIPQLFALRRQLAEFAREGRENRFQRHARMAAIVQEWALRHFDLFAEKGFRSDTVTCIRGTKSLSIAELIAHVQENGYEIANGYGPLRDKTFRIAHMGDRRETELEELLSQIEKSLETMT